MKTTLTKLLSEMPEYFTSREAAEERAEYLRIGTFKNAEVVKGDGRWIVIKRK